MQLEQQETFVIHGPQLEVLGAAESKLPAPPKKPAAENIDVAETGRITGLS